MCRENEQGHNPLFEEGKAILMAPMQSLCNEWSKRFLTSDMHNHDSRALRFLFQSKLSCFLMSFTPPPFTRKAHIWGYTLNPTQ